MRLNLQTEAEKNAHLEALKKTTVFLGQVSSLLRSKRFAKWYLSNESRFEWDGEKLFSRLRKDLIFQVKQAVRLNDDSTDIEYLHALTGRIDHCVERVEQMDGIKNTKKEKSLTIARDADVSDLIFALLTRQNATGLIRDIPDGFYVWNAVSSLITYAESRQTLARTTGHSRFEMILSAVTEEYLVNGYPHDLLAHDASDIRNNVKVKALMVRGEYCSTMMVKEDEPVLLSEGFDVISLKSAA